MKNLNLNQRLIILVIWWMMIGTIPSFGQLPPSYDQRKELSIPDLPGYKTLKCDFHIHTVFSDGKVWPTVRVREAWLEGLDAIAITDHIEYLPHKSDIPVPDFNRSYQIAKREATKLGLLLVKAAEITRPMPPGHFNALFIKDANLLQDENVFDVLQEANGQGAFLIWDHPGWEPMAPNGIKWYDEHTQLWESGLLNGLEVFNSRTFYPEALSWAVDRNLTVFANTDLHEPINLNFDIVNSHRPMTLVFARDNTMQSLKEALFEHRSVAYFDHHLAGPEKWMRMLFEASVTVDKSPLELEDKHHVSGKITNHTDYDIYMKRIAPQAEGVVFPDSITIKAHHSTRISIHRSENGELVGDNLVANYQVENFLVGEEKKLLVELEFQP